MVILFNSVNSIFKPKFNRYGAKATISDMMSNSRKYGYTEIALFVLMFRVAPAPNLILGYFALIKSESC
jgi:hypothetical protein